MNLKLRKRTGYAAVTSQSGNAMRTAGLSLRSGTMMGHPSGSRRETLMNEAQQPDEAQPQEQPPTPLVRSLGYGAGTMLAAGMVDLLAHLGPTGLVVGGIIAYAAAKHGPELVEQVRENLPSPASPQAARKTRNAPSKPRGSQSTRTLLDRALGRFPAEEEDTILVEEPEAPPIEPGSQTRRLVTEIAHPIRLSPELVVEGD